MRYSVWTNATAPQEILRGADLLKHTTRMKYLHYTGETYDRPTTVFYGGNIHTTVRAVCAAAYDTSPHPPYVSLGAAP